MRYDESVVLLGSDGVQDSSVLTRNGQRIYHRALDAGWEVPAIYHTVWCRHLYPQCTTRCSSFCTATQERTTVDFNLIDPNDLHIEAYGAWTEGRWDFGCHYADGQLHQFIKCSAFRALAKLPPSRYELRDGTWTEAGLT